MNYKVIEGGVTAAKGFLSSGIHCGIRKNKTKPDLGLIYSEVPCTAAAVYTQNLIKGAPIQITKQHLENGTAQAVIVNSGNANTCNGDGEEKAKQMCQIAAEVLQIKSEEVIVASTGVIGQVLPIEPIRQSAKELYRSLNKEGSQATATAIMTTDTYCKQAAVTCVIGDKTVSIGGIAKGSGMIHPNMATMLSFVTTDCAITTHMLQSAITTVANNTFNMISIDGDSSTNDTFAVMANGLAGNPLIDKTGEAFDVFCNALEAVCETLSLLMAGDGEGATKLLICEVHGAQNETTAKAVAKSVIASSLLKAAMFGEDANWGRVLCAVGYAGVELDIKTIDVAFASAKGTVQVCQDGHGIDFSEKTVARILSEKEITIGIDLNNGSASAKAYGCDLTYEYVRINGDYRT